MLDEIIKNQMKRFRICSVEYCCEVKKYIQTENVDDSPSGVLLA